MIRISNKLLTSFFQLLHKISYSVINGCTIYKFCPNVSIDSQSQSTSKISFIKFFLHVINNQNIIITLYNLLMTTQKQGNKLKSVKPRVTKTFIHTDIFGFELPEETRVRNIPTFISHVFDQPAYESTALRNIRNRPHDHEDQFFYDQRDYANNAKSEVIEKSECLPANYTLSHKVKEIFPSSVQEGSGASILRKSWFNDAKQIQFNKLNNRINRGYSANRKQIQLQSNAFDFIQFEDNILHQQRPLACVVRPLPEVISVLDQPLIKQKQHNKQEIKQQTKGQQKKKQTKPKKVAKKPNSKLNLGKKTLTAKFGVTRPK